VLAREAQLEREGPLIEVGKTSMEAAANSPTDRPVAASRSPTNRRSQRSRVTNHEDLLPGLDGRSSAARRFRDLVGSYVVDMGGLGQCSEIRLGLLRRLAATTVQCELLEAQMVNGLPVDIATLCTLASTAMRLSVRLGLERRAKDVSELSLGDILRRGIEEQRQP
jgi:hypothetical protein